MFLLRLGHKSMLLCGFGKLSENWNNRDLKVCGKTHTQHPRQRTENQCFSYKIGAQIRDDISICTNILTKLLENVCMHKPSAVAHDDFHSILSKTYVKSARWRAVPSLLLLASSLSVSARKNVNVATSSAALLLKPPPIGTLVTITASNPGNDDGP